MSPEPTPTEGSRGPPPAQTRRQLLVGAGGLCGVAVGLEGLVLEPNRLSVTRHRIGDASLGSEAPIRLTAITDLHLRRIGALEEAVASEVVENEPDAVLLIGDSVDRADSLGLLGDFMSLLPSRVPKYATLGNWEYWSGVDVRALGALYGRFGGRLLVNESVRLVRGGRDVLILGVDDLVAGRPDLARAWGDHAGAGDAILLAHCPAYRDLVGAPGAPITAMLSGHTHGGQIALGAWAPVRPAGSGRYVAGWYRDGFVDLYVSRGVGTSVIPVRFGSTPEVAHFEWFAATPRGGTTRGR